MSIQRVPSVPFTQIANSALRDRRLSFKARGLLAMVLTNVGEWNASLNWLIAQSDHDGRVAVQAALNELTECGYRVVTKEQDAKGLFHTVVTWHHDPNVSITRPTENPTVGLSDRRKTGGSIEEHLSEHHLKEHQTELELYPTDLFGEFWKAYPRKVGKGQATKAWAKAAKGTDPVVLVTAAVEFRQWCEADQTEPNFIPHPATWLNGERWLDERPTPRNTNMQAHMALVQELWENQGVENPRQLGV